MTTVTYNPGAATAYAVAGSLPAANYDTTATIYNNTTNKPADVLFDYVATLGGTPTGNKQIVLFIQGSMDGTNWGPVPSSPTDTTHDPMFRLLGAIAVVAAEAVRPPAPFSVAAAFGGMMPSYWRVIVKNDTGVALSGASARTQEVTLTSV